MEFIYHDHARIQEIRDFVHLWENNDEYIQCKSSGTTGQSKTIDLAKSDMRISAQKTLKHLGISPGAKAGLALSTETIAGKMMIVRALIGQLELHVLPVVAEPLTNIELPLDLLALVPLQAYHSIGKVSEPQRKACLLIGGSPITRIQFEAIQSFWTNAYQTFGMTETSSHVAIRAFSEGYNAPLSALPGIYFSSQNGLLEIHSPDFSFKSITTSDVVSLIDDQRFKFLGREDFIINVNGIKINPESIEEIIAEKIRTSFVICPFDDEIYGQSIGIVFEGEFPNEFHDFIQTKNLPSYQIPRKFQVHSSFIKTKSGKLDRRSLWEETKNHEWKSLL